MIRKRASRVVSVIALMICVTGHLYGADQHGVDQPNVLVIINDEQAWTDYGLSLIHI